MIAEMRTTKSELSTSRIIHKSQHLMGVGEALSLKCEDSGEGWTVSGFEFTNNSTTTTGALSF